MIIRNENSVRNLKNYNFAIAIFFIDAADVYETLTEQLAATT